jgi:GNAT superfamily N-acetyltransferase
MSSTHIYIGKNSDIPEKYHEQYFALRQQCDEEFHGFLPASIEFYRNMWTVGREKGSDLMKVIAVNEKDLVVGYGVSIWSTMYENLDRAFFRLYVVPQERRKGIGSKMLKAIAKKLPEEIKILFSDAPRETSGDYFLRKFNKDSSYVEEIVIVDLQELQIQEIEAEAQKQRRKALSKGYEIKRVNNWNYQNYFDEEEFVGIVEQIWNDMPREELKEEDMVLTVERHQAIYERNKRAGHEYISFVAVHKETSKPVGYTNYSINKFQPGIAWQDDTGIVPEHRGNGLGLALKYQSLLTLIKESKAKYWRTSSSQTNKHMLNINTILGHKLWQQEPIYEFERKKVQES